MFLLCFLPKNLSLQLFHLMNLKLLGRFYCCWVCVTEIIVITYSFFLLSIIVRYKKHLNLNLSQGQGEQSTDNNGGDYSINDFLTRIPSLFKAELQQYISSLFWYQKLYHEWNLHTNEIYLSLNLSMKIVVKLSNWC